MARTTRKQVESKYAQFLGAISRPSVNHKPTGEIMPSLIFGNHARKIECRHGKQPLEYCHICDANSEAHEPTLDDLDAIASWNWADYRAQLAEFGYIENGERVYPQS